MKSGSCSDEACILFSELLTDFERIGDHALNIAQERGRGRSRPVTGGKTVRPGPLTGPDFLPEDGAWGCLSPGRMAFGAGSVAARLGVRREMGI